MPHIAIITVICIQIFFVAATLALYFRGAGLSATISVSSGILISELILALYLSLRKTSAKSSEPFIQEMPVSFKDAIEFLNDKNIKKELSGVYILSNESQIDATIQAVENADDVQNDKLKCHLGVGGLHNFDIMAARRSNYGVIFDFNPNNQKFINQCLKFISVSETSEMFVEKVCTYMESNIGEYNHYEGYDSPICRMQVELERPSSWLWQKNTTGRFQHIKKLVEEGKIVAITQDFCHIQAFHILVEIIQKFDCFIDTLYLSNIYCYLPLNSFYTTFDILTSTRPLVIHCTPPDSCRCTHGCQCSKVQTIGRLWKKVSKEEGAIKVVESIQ